MKKLLTVIFLVLGLLVGMIGLSACELNGGEITNEIKEEKQENENSQGGITFKTLAVDGNSVYGKVSNDTTTFSFLDEVETKGKAKYTVSFDRNGNQVIASKNVDLEIGDNTFYISVMVDGNMQSFYEATVRRRPIYTVSFDTGNGTAVANQRVEEDNFATEPDTTRAGYTFTGWTYDFNEPITADTTITTEWEANTDTKYKVEYYLENFENDNYTLYETENLTGTTDMTAVAEIKIYEHFTPTNDNVTGNINGNGDTVLKVYYQMERFTVKISASGNVTLNKTYNGSYKYGTEIPETTATFNNYLGYEWKGWYSDNEFMTYGNTIPSFTIDKNVNYVADGTVKEEMSNFNFTSDATTCRITSIKDTTVTEIIIPDYVTSIGAFYECTSLTSITIGGSVTSIVRYAFYECTSLTSVTIGSSVTSIGYSAFGYCSSLTSINIPDSVTSIGDRAFYYCIRLTSITIGGSVTSIGSGAFYYCSSLTSITIPDSVTSIGSSAFYGCSNLTSVTIGNGVTSIGALAFYYCSSLTSITIPDSVTSIGGSAFEHCSSLTSITFNGTKSEWNAISKESFWKLGVPATVVHCADGDVNI